jgi:hypothetical protein
VLDRLIEAIGPGKGAPVDDIDGDDAIEWSPV